MNVNTLEKRTFYSGASVELFQRKDGTYRIKYTGSEGDELIFNHSTKEMMRQSAQTVWQDLMMDAEQEHRLASDGPDKLTEFHFELCVLKRLITRCGRDFRDAAEMFGDGRKSSGLTAVAIVGGTGPEKVR